MSGVCFPPWSENKFRVNDMCTWEEGVNRKRIFFKYRDGKEVDEEDKAILDRLVLSGSVRYEYINGIAYAKAYSNMGGLKDRKSVQGPSSTRS